MRRTLLSFAASLLFGMPAAGAEAPAGLTIYWIDTEGGAATLIVTPQRESVLIDCGNPGAVDAERIHKTLTEQAKLEAIDHLILTHWHTDHFGGVARLSQLVQVRNYYHHGIREKLPEDPVNYPLLIGAFKKAAAGKEKVLRPGDQIELKQTKGGPALSMLCLCGDGKVIAAKDGAPENPIAKDHKPQPEDPTDNARSLGFLVKFGDFKFLDLGDLTWNIEYQLVSPSDKIGPIDVYQSTHHGLDISNNTVLMRTVKPTIAVFNNGPRKGGAASVIAELRRIPETQAIYQMHRNLTVGAAENTEPDKIANTEEKMCPGKGIRLSVAPDCKSYTVTVGDSGKAREYAVR
jgi:beta-lactamase superfamily II metal-dependent hydrolase